MLLVSEKNSILSRLLCLSLSLLSSFEFFNFSLIKADEANLWRGIDPSEVRIGIEIEMFPKRLRYLLPYLKLGPKLIKKYGSDEIAAKALIDLGHNSYEWGENATEEMKKFEVGLDYNVVELRLKDTGGIQSSIDSMKSITDRVHATELLFSNILKDDLTEGIEYHLHISFRDPSNPSTSQVKTRLRKINRLYMLEYMALGPDRDGVLNVSMENYHPNIATRGQVRHMGGNHFELRWHHTSPDDTLEKTIKYMQMSDEDFNRAILTREKFLLKENPSILSRISTSAVESFIDAFFVVPDSPLTESRTNLATQLMTRATDAGILKALKSPNPTYRILAAYLIKNRSGPNIPEMINIALHDKDPSVRVTATRALEQNENSRSLEFIRLALKDNDPRVKLAAIQAIVGKSDPAYETILKKLISSKDYETKTAAANAIAHMDELRKSSLLSSLINDPSPQLRLRAILSSSNVSRDEALQLVKSGLQDPEMSNRLSAARCLGNAKSESPELFEMILKQKYDPLTLSALSGLVWDQSREKYKIFLRALKHRNPAVRDSALQKFYSHNDTDAFSLVKIATHDRNPQIRAKAALGLYYHLKNPEMIELTIAGLNDSSSQVRAVYAKYLTRIDSPIIKKLYLKAIKDSDPDVRSNFIASLSDETQTIQEKFALIAIKDPDVNVRMAAINLSGKLSQPIAHQVLREGLTGKTEAERICASNQLPSFKPQDPSLTLLALSDPSVRVRNNAISSLKTLDTEFAIKKLQTLAKSPDPDVRYQVASTLNYLKSNSALNLIKQLIKDNEPRVKLTAIRSLYGIINNQPDQIELIIKKILTPLMAEGVFEVTNAVLDLPLSNSEATRKLLLLELKNQDINLKLKVFNKMNELSIPIPSEELINTFNSVRDQEEHLYTLRRIMDFIQNTRKPELIEFCKTLLDYPDGTVGMKSYTVLKAVQDPSLPAVRLKFMKGKNYNLIMNILAETPFLNSKESRGIIKIALTSTNLEVRVKAAQNLVWDENPETIKLFEYALRDPNPRVRDAAFSFLENLKPLSSNLLEELSKDTIGIIRQKVTQHLSDQAFQTECLIRELKRGFSDL